jgi:phosphoribosylglycinamide formyltransferase-1
MMTKAKSRERIERAAEICLSLPKVTRADMGDHAAFRVGGKIFAYLLNNHHGDSIVGLWCRALPGDNQRLIESNPRKFYMPAYVGPRGWVGLRLDLRTVDWSEVRELLHGSYLLVAPKKLALQMDVQLSGSPKREIGN